MDDLRLVTAPHSILDSAAFPTAAALFLIEAGLPGSCAPFLSFDPVAQGPLSLAQYFGNAGPFSPSDLARLSSFYVLGHDGRGNPLWLDSSRGGEIVWLDHEDRFQTRRFVASSVQTLAEALIVIHTVPHAHFVEHLRGFDPLAADKAAFLPSEVAMLSH